MARRHRSHLAPRRTKYRKAQKGRVPLPTGGSTAGTTLTIGRYGMRVCTGSRLTAAQLSAIQLTVKRKIKVCKGAKFYFRVFPDIPVTRKGNEVRMGKGKGAFDHWVCRVPPGRVVFELGGTDELRPELAKEAIRLAAHKMPVRVEFLDREQLARAARLAAKKDAAMPQQQQQLEKAEGVPLTATATA
ncbi:ribosomal protein L10e/L16 [Syncephalis pseudoplumigaleata]|uniref:Ribosomal protein L10e/L16 n=1 Tax=Syncephalis pseudoplumigaleata TaxID=1712513 RepID=A0A4V1J218_9FUNG|nr:ribosomal protein L10e/L16 [Syncephalis pseudoplumigaleata]|eukprot:RKP27009.1 ribosomal protein L10e/L16 [Syncephalis pseudoplumigaleata]